jgi:hypothetical protein
MYGLKLQVLFLTDNIKIAWGGGQVVGGTTRGVDGSVEMENNKRREAL